MPLVRLEVRNEYRLGDPELYKKSLRKEDPKAILDGVAVAGLVGILWQLGDLADLLIIFHFSDVVEEEVSVFRIFIDEPGYGDLHWVSQVTREGKYVQYDVPRQFGSQDGSSETQVIDYKTQQSRFFPLLASAYAFRFIGQWLKCLYNDVTERLRANDFSTLPEAHACTAGLKSLTTSFTNLKYSRVEIDEMRFEWAECMLNYI
ncbi:hypothetical protein ZIOFF_062662 [Zingiber officinale]|uniref:Acyl-CoA oxidase C-alpha1 domain-containing protein n=1 Tax=Zingiber officinale TaxID=94328 RepID=A0A8J5KAW2_ZINOF|nr:hypothetical protein ZIOFF_062662 [Zingiber officinale]